MSELGPLTSPEATTTAALLIPLGATEQHGPHLPLDTDTRIATALAHRSAQLVPGARTAPSVAYGASGEHQGFPGTLSIGTNAMRLLLVELVRSVAGAMPVMCINGHGGNTAAVTAAMDQLQAEGHQVASWSPRIPGGDAHAGHTETSLMLALAPETVRMDQAVAGRTEPLRELLPELMDKGLIGVAPNGVLGDPTGASAVEGERLLELLVNDLAGAVRAMLGQ